VVEGADDDDEVVVVFVVLDAVVVVLLVVVLVDAVDEDVVDVIETDVVLYKKCR
jgi:hypothetical protein